MTALRSREGGKSKRKKTPRYTGDVRYAGERTRTLSNDKTIRHTRHTPLNRPRDSAALMRGAPVYTDTHAHVSITHTHTHTPSQTFTLERRMLLSIYNAAFGRLATTDNDRVVDRMRTACPRCSVGARASQRRHRHDVVRSGNDVTARHVTRACHVTCKHAKRTPHGRSRPADT